MSKISNISRTGWLVVGIVAALLLVPATAVAVTATATIIQGGTAADQASVTAHRLQTNDEIKGYSGNNFAAVTYDGQLLTTTTDPSTFVNNTAIEVDGGTGYQPVFTAPTGNAVVVTTIHLDTASDPTPGPTENIVFTVQPGTGCPGSSRVGDYSELVSPGSLGETDIPFNPGLAIPTGDALCAKSSGPIVDLSVTGYLVSSIAVPPDPLHRLRALPRQHS
jgi:hypothetical protein